MSAAPEVPAKLIILPPVILTVVAVPLQPMAAVVTRPGATPAFLTSTFFRARPDTWFVMIAPLLESRPPRIKSVRKSLRAWQNHENACAVRAHERACRCVEVVGEGNIKSVVMITTGPAAGGQDLPCCVACSRLVNTDKQ